MPTKTKATPATAKKKGKAPSDHKAKGEREMKTLPDEVAGWDLLIDFAGVPVWDQTDLVNLVEELSSDSSPMSYKSMSTTELKAEVQNRNGEEDREDPIELPEKAAKGQIIAILRKDDSDNGERVSMDMSVIGKLAKALIPYAVDEKEYTKFVSGPGALERAAHLGMAWVGQMGGSKNSED